MKTGILVIITGHNAKFIERTVGECSTPEQRNNYVSTRMWELERMFPIGFIAKTAIHPKYNNVCVRSTSNNYWYRLWHPGWLKLRRANKHERFMYHVLGEKALKNEIKRENRKLD